MENYQIVLLIILGYFLSTFATAYLAGKLEKYLGENPEGTVFLIVMGPFGFAMCLIMFTFYCGGKMFQTASGNPWSYLRNKGMGKK